MLRHGLLRASFIPPREIRELRELTRYRQTLLREHTAVANRLQKLLESGNIKLGQVASDVLGLSGRLRLYALAEGGQDARKLAELAQGKLKNKKDALRQALVGRLTQVQRWVLGELLARIEELDAARQRVETRIGEEVEQCPDPFVKEAVVLLDSMPGGANMSRARLSPGLGSIWRGFLLPPISRVGRGCVRATMSQRANARVDRRPKAATSYARPWSRPRGQRRGRRAPFWPPSITAW